VNRPRPCAAPDCGRLALARLTIVAGAGGSDEADLCLRDAAARHAELRDMPAAIIYAWSLLPGTLLGDVAGDLARLGLLRRTFTNADVPEGGRTLPPVLRMRRA
jgi:hypothetical protein